RVEKPSDVVNRGDKVKAMVISVDKDTKKIALSIKSATNIEAQNVASYVKQMPTTTTMADKLKDFKIGGSDE
ncbi:MAG: S1 RNA-binding domain-containing protein, partial [Bacteriovoracaceae bacterium]